MTRRIRILITIDFDALSGLLGTGQLPQNSLSDYTAAAFSGNVGVPRLLRLLSKYELSDRVTWFVPGHSMESFPAATKAIAASGAELALHGYCHEGADQMNPQQQHDVMEKCIELYRDLTGDENGPKGYRAPLYQMSNSTIALLREFGCFQYDTSLSGHDSLPYLLPDPMPEKPTVPIFSDMQARDWMVPALGWEGDVTSALGAQKRGSTGKSLLEIPASWYTEDMTPMTFYPHTNNTQGYVSSDVVENMWWDRLMWLWENECEQSNESGSFDTVFPLIWHPETAGRAHIIPMIERILKKLLAFKKDVEDKGDGEVLFSQMKEVAAHVLNQLKE